MTEDSLFDLQLTPQVSFGKVYNRQMIAIPPHLAHVTLSAESSITPEVFPNAVDHHGDKSHV